MADTSVVWAAIKATPEMAPERWRVGIDASLLDYGDRRAAEAVIEVLSDVLKSYRSIRSRAIIAKEEAEAEIRRLDRKSK